MIQTLLLAAGRSARFGSDKLLAPMPDGTPLVLASARALRAADCAVLAVVREPGGDGRDGGAGGETGRLLAGLPGVRVIGCAAAARGLGHSLACGVAASAQASGWLVALADMPGIQPATLRRLLAALAHGASIVAPRYRGQRGHPVGFHRHWRDALGACQGDRGARDLLNAHADRLVLIDVDDPGVVQDIDRPADLAALVAAAATRDGRPTIDGALAADHEVGRTVERQPTDR